MPLLPLYAFTEWTGTTFTFYIIEEAVGNVAVVGDPRENRTRNIYTISRLRQNAWLIKIIHQKLLVVNPFLQRLRCQSSIPRHASAGALVDGCCQPVLTDVPVSPSFLAHQHLQLSEAYATASQLINSFTIHVSYTTREGEISIPFPINVIVFFPNAISILQL